eukprot:gene16121-22265_t
MRFSVNMKESKINVKNMPSKSASNEVDAIISPNLRKNVVPSLKPDVFSHMIVLEKDEYAPWSVKSLEEDVSAHIARRLPASMAHMAIPMDVKEEGLICVPAAEGTAPMGLGSGASLCQGYLERTHNFVAIKGSYWVSLEKFYSEETRKLQNEVTLMLMLDGHRNVAGALGWFIESRVDSCGNWTYRGCIVEDLGPESLASFVKRNGPTMDLAVLTKLLYGMVRGMKTLLRFKIIHNDLNPNNVLVSKVADGKKGAMGSLLVQICDFGVAEGVNSPDAVLPGALGTDAYNNNEPGSFFRDVFGFGKTVKFCLSYLDASTQSAGIIEELHAMADRAMRPSPRDRPSLETLLLDLKLIISSQMIMRGNPGTTYGAVAVADEAEIDRARAMDCFLTQRAAAVQPASTYEPVPSEESAIAVAREPVVGNADPVVAVQPVTAPATELVVGGVERTAAAARPISTSQLAPRFMVPRLRLDALVVATPARPIAVSVELPAVDVKHPIAARKPVVSDVVAVQPVTTPATEPVVGGVEKAAAAWSSSTSQRGPRFQVPKLRLDALVVAAPACLAAVNMELPIVAAMHPNAATGEPVPVFAVQPVTAPATELVAGGAERAPLSRQGSTYQRVPRLQLDALVAAPARLAVLSVELPTVAAKYPIAATGEPVPLLAVQHVTAPATEPVVGGVEKAATARSSSTSQRAPRFQVPKLRLDALLVAAPARPAAVSVELPAVAVDHTLVATRELVVADIEPMVAVQSVTAPATELVVEGVEKAAAARSSSTSQRAPRFQVPKLRLDALLVAAPARPAAVSVELPAVAVDHTLVATKEPVVADIEPMVAVQPVTAPATELVVGGVMKAAAAGSSSTSQRTPRFQVPRLQLYALVAAPAHSAAVIMELPVVAAEQPIAATGEPVPVVGGFEKGPAASVAEPHIATCTPGCRQLLRVLCKVLMLVVPMLV